MNRQPRLCPPRRHRSRRIAKLQNLRRNKKVRLVKDLGEWRFISGLLKDLKADRKTRSIVVGPGDDAAVYRSSTGHVWVATTDALVEDTHFKRKWLRSWDLLGFKALAINLSDLAAMGGVVPVHALVSIGIPPTFPLSDLQAIYKGLRRAAKLYGVSLIGGNTTRSETIFISVTLLGEARPEDILLRSGAKPGDAVFVTGTLGDAAMGLEILRLAGLRSGHVPKHVKYALDRFLSPKPRLEWGRKLARSRFVNSMIDCSDGLLRSVEWLKYSSGAGAVIEADKIPVSEALKKWAEAAGKNAWMLGLRGGEDYELVFTVPETAAQFIRNLVPCTKVGRITKRKEGISIFYKGEKITSPGGVFEHFA